MERDIEADQDQQTPVQKESARYSPLGREQEQIPLMERESVSGKSASEKEDVDSVASSDYLHYDHTRTDSGGTEITPGISDSGQVNYDNSGGTGDVIPSTSSGCPQYPHDHDVTSVGGKNLERFPPVIYTKDNSKDVKPAWIFRQASENKGRLVPSSGQPHLVSVAPKEQLQQSFTNPKMVDQKSDKYSSEDCNTSGSSQSQNSSGEDRYVSGLEADGNNTPQNDTIPKINQVLETPIRVTHSNGFLQEDSITSAQSEPSGSSSSDGNKYSPGHAHKCNGEDKDGMEWDSSDDEVQYTKQKHPEIPKDPTKFGGEDFPVPEDDDDETDPVKMVGDFSPTDGNKYSSEDCNTSDSLESHNFPIENRRVPDRAAHGGYTPTKSRGNATNPKREDHVSKIPRVVANGNSYIRENSNTSDQSHLSTSSSSDGNGYAPVHGHVIPMAPCNGECHEEEDDGMEWDSSDDEIQYTKQKRSEIQKDPTKFAGEDFPVPNDDDSNDDE